MCCRFIQIHPQKPTKQCCGKNARPTKFTREITKFRLVGIEGWPKVVHGEHGLLKENAQGLAVVELKQKHELASNFDNN